MMIEGRLVWSRLRDEPGWYTWSHGEQFCYHAKPVTGGWEASAGQRGADRVSLGKCRLLTDAKRLADYHHHEHIRQAGSIGLYEYILKYPVGGKNA